MIRKELKIMKKIFKKEVIIAFIIGIILASSIAVYAYSYAARDVSYTKLGENTPISVEAALNDLYNKRNISAQQVYTITAPSIEYTFQNNGCIVGTMNNDGVTGNAVIFASSLSAEEVDDDIILNYEYRTATSVCINVSAGTTIHTRKNKGSYDLKIYEFK